MIALYIYVAYDSIQSSDIFSITEVAKGTTYAFLFFVFGFSYTLYKMFDDLILLAKGGLTVYHGPVKKVEEYFAGVGINVPERVNPPDHLIDILEGIVKPGGGLCVEQLPVRWMLHNGYPVPHDMMQLLDQTGSSSKEVNPSVDDSHPLVGEPWKEKQQSMTHILNPRDLSNRVTPGVLRQYRYYLGRYKVRFTFTIEFLNELKLKKEDTRKKL